MTDANRERPIGYVLVEPNTHAIDWDGVIHSTLDGAVREVVVEVYNGRYGFDDMPYRPDEREPVAYRVMAVVPCPEADAKVLAKMRAEWDLWRADEQSSD